MRKIFCFIVGSVCSFFVFLYGHPQKTTYKIDYNVKIRFKEKKIPEGVIPLFIQPLDSDKTNFIMYKNEKYFTDLMVRYLYVPVEEEGLLYALLASNKFGIKEAEYYIYRYLAIHPFSKFTYDFGIEHLKKGVRLGAIDCISEYKYIKEHEKEKFK